MMHSITQVNETVRMFGSLFAKLTIAPSIVFLAYSIIFSVFHLTAFPWELMIILIPNIFVSSLPFSFGITVFTWAFSKMPSCFSDTWRYMVAIGSAIYMALQIGFLPSAEQKNQVGFTGLTLLDPAGAVGIILAGLVAFLIIRHAFQNQKTISNSSKISFGNSVMPKGRD